MFTILCGTCTAVLVCSPVSVAVPASFSVITPVSVWHLQCCVSGLYFTCFCGKTCLIWCIHLSLWHLQRCISMFTCFCGNTSINQYAQLSVWLLQYTISKPYFTCLCDSTCIIQSIHFSGACNTKSVCLPNQYVHLFLWQYLYHSVCSLLCMVSAVLYHCISM